MDLSHIISECIFISLVICFSLLKKEEEEYQILSVPLSVLNKKMNEKWIHVEKKTTFFFLLFIFFYLLVTAEDSDRGGLEEEAMRGGDGAEGC